MFYVKTNSNGLEMRVGINHNVYTQCPECGKEIHVDLNKLYRAQGADIDTTIVLCRDCSEAEKKG